MKINCAYQELLALDDPSIIPNPDNPNDHSEDQIERLAKIIDYQGQRSPIVISNLSGFITKGHGRLMAIKKLGWDKIAVDYQDYENKAQEWADIVADNAIAEWSILDLSKINDEALKLEELDIDMLGIKDFQVTVPETLEPGCDEDEAPEPPEEPVTKRGDVWLLGDHRLMCGDSTMIDDVEKLMNGEKADMVFTDPPYGDNHASMEMNRKAMKSGVGNIVSSKNMIKGDNDISFLSEVAVNISTFSKEKSPKIVFFKWSKWEQVKKMFSVFGEPSSCCVWDRDSIAAAIYIFNPVHEFAFFWGSLAEKQNKSNLTNVWRCRKERENKKLHPTVKPIEIIENAIEAACKKYGLIIDLFLGSGSTLIACEKTNRKCYGMELDEKYVQVAIERWQKYAGKEAKLESTGETYNQLKEARNGQK